MLDLLLVRFCIAGHDQIHNQWIEAFICIYRSSSSILFHVFSLAMALRRIFAAVVPSCCERKVNAAFHDSSEREHLSICYVEEVYNVKLLDWYRSVNAQIPYLHLFCEVPSGTSWLSRWYLCCPCHCGNDEPLPNDFLLAWGFPTLSPALYDRQSERRKN